MNVFTHYPILAGTEKYSVKWLLEYRARNLLMKARGCNVIFFIVQRTRFILFCRYSAKTMLNIFFSFKKMFTKNHPHSHPDTTHPLPPRYILPPPLDVPGNLWAEIPYYTVYRFNPTPDIPPQIAVNKQWRFVEVGQLMLLAVDVRL